MAQEIMNVFQTYKAFSLKNTWEKDLESIRHSKRKVFYKYCLPWRNFVGLSIELAIFIMIFLLYVGIKEFGIWSLPLILVISPFIALKPLLYILMPLALYNVIKIHYNKWRNKNKVDLIAFKQKEEAFEINLQTIRNGLTNHSVVPPEFQTEEDLQQMMVNLKNGKAVDDSHAVYLHSLHKKIETQDKT